MDAIKHDSYPLFPYPVPMVLVPDFSQVSDPEDIEWYRQREELATKAASMLAFCEAMHETYSETVAHFCEAHDIEAITFDTPVPADVAIACTMLARIELIGRWINEVAILEIWDAIPAVEEYLFRAIGSGQKIQQVNHLEELWTADGDEDIPAWPSEADEDES